MPIFTYKALTESGGSVSGESVAASVKELTDELSQKGLLVQAVEPKPSFEIRLFSGAGINNEKFLLFNQEFIALLSAGLSVSKALEMVSERPGEPVFSATLKNIYSAVENGEALSEACGKHPETFDPLFISAIKTGEKAGNIVVVLKRYQKYLKGKIALQRKISQAFAYPLFLLITMFVIVAVLLVFVMPRFVTMYADLDTALPVPTQILLQLLHNLHIYGPAMIAILIFGMIAFKYYTATSIGKYRVDKYKLDFPYLGGIVRLHLMAYMTRTLSTLLAGGATLVEALHATSGTLSNSYYQHHYKNVITNVVDGKSLTESFKNQDMLTSSAIKMVEAGEASGNLDSLLGDIAEYYEETLDYRITRMTALIEPLLMLLIGILVGGVIVVMYLPIFSIAGAIQ